MSSPNSNSALNSISREDLEGYQQAGLQKLEEQGKKFGGVWPLLFFLCGCLVTVAGALSIMAGVMYLYPFFDFINFVALTGFGLLMVFLDAPVDIVYVRNVKFAVFHYALFLTRFIGRGIW